MKKRCNNKNSQDYRWYGARGIKMCREWEHDFKAFDDYITALPNANKDGYTIDRIDCDKGYEPGNIRWATASEQFANRKRRM